MPYRLPDRAVNSEHQLTGQLQHPFITGITEIPLLVDIEKRDPRFQRGIHVASAGDQHIHLLIPHHVEQRPGIAIFQHHRFTTHQFPDTRLILFGGFLGAGGDHLHTQVL